MRPIFPAGTGCGLPPPPLGLPAAAPEAPACRPRAVAIASGGVGGLADHVNNPAFATAVGLVMYAHRNHVGDVARPVGAGAFGRVAGRLRTLFKEFF